MSDRLHVAKKWDVQYSEISEFPFKFQIEEFHDILGALGIDNQSCYDTDFECPKMQWEDGMSLLTELYTLEKEDYEIIKKKLDKVNITPEDMHRCMEQCYNASYPYDDYIHISFF